jgi:hypothetical protein
LARGQKARVIREAKTARTYRRTIVNTTIPDESAIRRKAKRHGYFVRKSRERTFHSNDYGEFMLVSAQYKCPILGWNYDATLEDIADFLSDEPVTA